MIIILNNKSNLNKEEYNNYIKRLLDINKKNNIVLCPTFLNIGNTKEEKILLGAQNVSLNDDGAYTGEISAKQLKSYNVGYCLVGHSERRKYQNESHQEINIKIKKLLENNIIPILCIGETKEERENNQVYKVLEKEIELSLKNISDEEKNKIIVAYEPIWSIGTGIVPTPEEIEKAMSFIKNLLPKTKIIYGGSVNQDNIDLFKNISILDGFLLGGLSLKTDMLDIFLKKLE